MLTRASSVARGRRIRQPKELLVPKAVAVLAAGGELRAFGNNREGTLGTAEAEENLLLRRKVAPPSPPKCPAGSSAMGAYRIGNCVYRVEGLTGAELAEAVEAAQRRARTNESMWERELGPLDWEGAGAEKGRLSSE